MREFPLSKVYTLLEPGPVVLLTTIRNGRANIMTMSWHMMVEFEPPLVACVVSNRNFSFGRLRQSKECVIAIPARKLAAKVVKIGNSSGRDIDKFVAFGLTSAPAKRVAPPRNGGQSPGCTRFLAIPHEGWSASICHSSTPCWLLPKPMQPMCAVTLR